MVQLLIVLVWLGISALGLLGTAAVCRAGHTEDVARGFTDPEGPVHVPAPRSGQAEQVTHR